MLPLPSSRERQTYHIILQVSPQRWLAVGDTPFDHFNIQPVPPSAHTHTHICLPASIFAASCNGTMCRCCCLRVTTVPTFNDPVLLYLPSSVLVYSNYRVVTPCVRVVLVAALLACRSLSFIPALTIARTTYLFYWAVGRAFDTSMRYKSPKIIK